MSRIKDEFHTFFNIVDAEIKKDLNELGIEATWDWAGPFITICFNNTREMNLYRLCDKRYKGFFGECMDIQLRIKDQ